MKRLFAITVIAGLGLFNFSDLTHACNGNYFHVDDFAGLNGGNFGHLTPIAGNHSLWCGVRASQSMYPTDGYGNNWDECWESCDFSVTPGDTSVLVLYDLCYHSEPGHDYLYFEYFDGANWVTMKTYNGVLTCLQESVFIPPPTVNTIRFRFRFISDAAGSDEDGDFDGDGAAIIDNINVAINMQLVDVEDFECEASGAQTTINGIWAAGPHPACSPPTDCVTFINASCDNLCLSLGVPLEQVGFENLDPSDFVEGLGTVNPFLNIKAVLNPFFGTCSMSPVVIEEGNPFPYWAYKSGNNGFHGCLSGTRGMVDPQDCVDDYQFTFAPGYEVSCFTIHMLDFGDYFSFSGNTHTVTLTAYDGNNSQVDQDVLTFQGGVQTFAGDACNALPGDPGNYLFEVQGNGIKRVMLEFLESPDSRIGFDDIGFCGMTQNISCVQPPQGLKGWWSGDLILDDYSGYANNAVAVGGVSFSLFPRVRTGSFHLSGAEYLRVADNPSLDFGTAMNTGFGNFSFDAWVFLPDDVTGVNPVLSKFGPSGRGYSFSIINGKLSVTLESASIAITSIDNSTLAVAPNIWTHIGISVNRDPVGGPSVAYYVNGQAGSSLILPVQVASNMNNAGDLLIGAAQDPPTQFYNGELDEVEVFGKALPQSVFNDIYLADYAGKCVGTGVFHDCNSNGVDDKQDISSGTSHDYNGNDVPDECENTTGCGDHNKENIDFGNVAPGDTAFASFTISNTCGGPFSGAVVDTCGDFYVTSGTGPYTLAPGESLVVTIMYVPSAAGTSTCAIETGYYPGITCTGVSGATVAVMVQDSWSRWSGDRAVIGWRVDGASEITDILVERKDRGGNYRELDGIEIIRRENEFSCVDKSALPGREYAYRITLTGPEGKAVQFTSLLEIPAFAFALGQNHPNPFKASTALAFSIGKATEVELKIYDTTGRLIRTLVDARLDADSYERVWDGRDDSGRAAASGIYFYRLKAGAFTKTRKMALLR